jgi:hypothetical protein
VGGAKLNSAARGQTINRLGGCIKRVIPGRLSKFPEPVISRAFSFFNAIDNPR